MAFRLLFSYPPTFLDKQENLKLQILQFRWYLVSKLHYIHC